jgi:hypothetical protein
MISVDCVVVRGLRMLLLLQVVVVALAWYHVQILLEQEGTAATEIPYGIWSTPCQLSF